MRPNRLAGIIGALLVATIGATLHQTNVSIEVLSSRTTIIGIIVVFLLALLVGFVVGSISNTFDIFFQIKMLIELQKKGKISKFSRAKYLLWTMVFGGILSFVFTGLNFGLTSTVKINAFHHISWYTIPIVILGYVLLGAVGGIALALWVIIQKNRLIDQIDQFLLDLNDKTLQTLGIPQVSIATLQEILKLEKQIATNFMNRLMGEEDAPPPEHHIVRDFIFSMLGVGLGIGLLLGIILFYPTLWLGQVFAWYGNFMIYLGLILGVMVALLSGLPVIWPERKQQPETKSSANTHVQGTAFFTTGGIISAFAMVLLFNIINQPATLLLSAFMHSLFGFSLGFVLFGFAERRIRLFKSEQTANTSNKFKEVASDLLGIVVLFGLCFGTYAFVKSFGSSANNQLTVDVSSTLGWQDTNFYITSGDTITIAYQSGEWTVTNGVSAPTDANGLPANPPSYLYCNCGEPLPGVSTQALIGKIGSNGKPFLVGDLKTLNATASGDLFLRMNDSDAHLYDNSGDLVIQISTVQPTATPVPSQSSPKP